MLMVVSMNSSWKIHCTYFFVGGFSGAQQANLVRVYLEKLFDHGISVLVLVCDGPSCHLSMFTELGICFSPRKLKTWFPHPSDSKLKIDVLLDVCHILKLIRNTISEGGILLDSTGNKLYW